MITIQKKYKFYSQSPFTGANKICVCQTGYYYDINYGACSISNLKKLIKLT